MLTKEIQHLNQQSKNHQTQIHTLLRETRENIGNGNNNKNDILFKSIDHSLMLPNISDNNENINNNYQNYTVQADSVRNKLTNLNMSHDTGYGG